ncbi:hypothetical protein C4K35_1140 [Pseudomonas chlororaphis subsp. piscium]|nr:hypothetical protein C4K35_1140 [Pseudomonas chlororaphis subsp. piscium]AZC55309.1 hypothetical protein C4K34_1125 [Pseudomonas chlororaphis subsp. piscium]AZC74057.1 hypothetical protein C4K31_1135 [Pseudomonas chlororaphis subsp. piscium]AZC80274.1 hypothetical protein C4K30_1141 [Pseudomonas chlororaphis subsp. piscium]AZC87457.1 hypothetical protein C4K29_1136 [Pseudomonas chlororaphis subsp. piscium]
MGASLLPKKFQRRGQPGAFWRRMVPQLDRLGQTSFNSRLSRRSGT